MSEVISDDYPEHLNPFDDNYNPLASAPVAPPRAASSRQKKYNTWNSNSHQVVKSRPTFLEKPWAALNITPKGKLGRRLSILKTAVESFAIKKKKRLENSASDKEESLQQRSNSLHEDFNYRIVSPKLKEKIRQQVFSRSPSTQEQETEPKESHTPQINGSLSESLKPDSECKKTESCLTTCPESVGDDKQLGARPKTRKKRPPPPPPPVEVSKQVILDVQNHRSEDSMSANSSITQDLEKDDLTDDDISVVEVDKPGGKD